MPLPRIVYIHGDQTVHWDCAWVPSVARQLQAAGFETSFQLFPDSIEARAEYWLPFLEQHVRAGVNDLLLGWSCGAVAALRYAQEHAVRGLVLVAPYFTDLGLSEVRRSGFVVPAWDWERLRANAPTISMFHSDEDPWIPQAEFRALAEHLHVEVRIVRGAGHFAELTSFPELVEHIIQRQPM